MADDIGDKTEKPTGKRKHDARMRGNVAKSKDLSSAVMLLCGLIIFRVLGMSMFREMGLMLQRLLLPDTVGNQFAVSGLVGQIVSTVVSAARVSALPLGLIFVAAIAASYIQVGWLITFKPIQPDFSRLNPVKGFSNIFGKKGAAKSLADAGKFFVVTLVVVLVVISDVRYVVVLPQMDAKQAFVQAAIRLYDLALKVAIALLILGILDYIYQKWQHNQDLRMTKTEVKEERKTAEGDPKIKRKRMQMAQQIYMQRLGIDVPKADVIVTNPTHFAVALQYDSSTMTAPKVVAKGADLMAMRIRQIAVAHSVPIVERPPLARALYRNVEVGQEIPPAHYQAVAEVLAYVYRLEGRAAAG